MRASNLKQASLKQFTGQAGMPLTKARYDFITSKLVQMCAQDCRPLSIAEGKGFKEFCAALNPAYKPPVHATISAHLQLEYKKKKDLLIAELKGHDVAFTTDMWSSLGKQGYITVTYHYINDDWIMKSGVLATRHMPEIHTGLNIATRIDEIRKEYEITREKVAGISRDNAANMDVAVTSLGYPDTNCFGHTLQLAIKDALDHPEIQACISSCRNVVSHFNHSPKATGELRNQNTGKQKALQQDVATRWNSTYIMMNSLLPNRSAIYSVLHNKEFTKPDTARKLEIKNEHWMLIEKLCEVLKPFDVATSQLSGEKYPTLGSVYPLIHGIITNHLIAKEEDSPEVFFFKETVRKNLTERFMVGNEHQSDDIIATALHPRYKHLKFLGKQSRMMIQTRIEDLCEEIARKTTGKPETEMPELPVAPPKIKKESEEHCEAAMKYLMGDIYEVSDDEEESIETEVSRYMVEPRRLEEPLSWWKANASRFPHLQKLAKRFLCRPCTSVPSERLFSAAGHMVTKDRARLDPDTVDELLFLNSYYKRSEKKIQLDIESEKKNEATAETTSSEPTLPTLKFEN